jgi:CrcB protein
VKSVLLVFLGGGIGSVLRLAVYHAARLWLPPQFPWGTLLVNAIGGLVIGLVAGWFTTRSIGAGHPAMLFLITGVLGGFTTFSAFSLDAVLIWHRGDHGPAALYVASSLMLSIAGTFAGLALIRGHA